MGMTDEQVQTILFLMEEFGEYDYLNEYKPERAVHVDWNDYCINARITPDGQWENIHADLVWEP